MLARRIIPCLDVRNGRVVKGVRFREHEDVGDIVELAARYARQGADELVVYDITASPERRAVEPAWISAIAKRIDIPFCVAGGIRSIDHARARLFAGADKISINTPALQDPDLISRLATEFGCQCVVLGIDSVQSGDSWQVHQFTGDPEQSRRSGRLTMDWITEGIDRGAGEIVLNCMDRDGVRDGYDTEQLRAARAICSTPLIASGGAGKRRHFQEVFQTGVDGALAASVFHKDRMKISALKNWLAEQGVEMRT